jgi:DNA-binding winged helix-turn-helix (wHTH) protein
VAVEEKSEFSFYRPIRFNLFELDAKNGQLRRSGVPIDLSPQLLRVLVMLAERPGELVTRKEMKEALWQGQSYGDFDSRLNFVVKKLREVLGDDAEQPRYIQTVRGSGYRFPVDLAER